MRRDIRVAGGRGRASRRPARSTNLRKLTRRGSIVVLAAASFAAGVIVADRPNHDAQHLVTRYVTAWTHDRRGGDVRDARRGLQGARVRAPLRRRTDRRRATPPPPPRCGSPKIGDPHDGTIAVRMLVKTRIWGTLHETLEVPVTGSGSSIGVHLTPIAAVPGPARLRALAPPHGAADPRHAAGIRRNAAGRGPRSLLADPVGRRADRRHARVDPEARRRPLHGDGLSAETPRSAPTGSSTSSRRAWPARSAASCWPAIACWPASSRSRHAPVHTTINPGMETAAVEALAGQYAGIAVMDPRTGGLEALAGIAFSALQPPGSTMKIVTTVAALQAHLVTPEHRLPGRDRGDRRRLHAAERRRRGLRRHAAQRVRGLVQLGVRTARRQGRRQALPGRPQSGSASTTRRRSRARSSRRSRPRAWTPTPSSARRRSARVWCRRRR